MPGKKIYLSEWGWDTDGGGEPCTHSECVAEEAATVYAIRGLLIAARLGVDRATWYFFANGEASSSLYTRSGLTASKKANFKKKKIFRAFEHLLAAIGDKYFLGIYQEDEHLWAYHFGDPNGNKTHLVVWKPQDYDISKSSTIRINVPKKTTTIFSIANEEKILNFDETGNNELEFVLGKEPVIIKY